jgi:hypothetical protein
MVRRHRERGPRPKEASDNDLEQWSKRETGFKKLYDAVSELIIQEARVGSCACTNNLAGTDFIRVAALMANRQAIQKPNTEGFNAVQFTSRVQGLTLRA